MLIYLKGEPNENGRRYSEERPGLARLEFEQMKGDKVDGKYERRWHPYDCCQQFQIARRNIFPRISILGQIKHNLVASFSDRLHIMEWKRRLSSAKDFMNRLDEIAERYTSWKEGSFESDVGDGGTKVHRMWYKDTLAILQEILGDATL